jgi:ATP-dependent Clp protease, protease subunit
MSKEAKRLFKHLKNKNRTVKDFMTIINKNNSSADMYLYGDIVSSEWDKWTDQDVAPEDVQKFLSQINGVKNLNVYINSAGGSVFAGTNIYAMLKRHEATVTVHIDGVAASIASIIAMAADKIVMYENAYLMIHKPMVGAWGNAHELRKAADTLDALENGLVNAYEGKLAEGANIEDVRAMVDAETWLDGKTAAKYFDIELLGASEAVASGSEFLNEYKSIPEELKFSDGEAEPPEEVIEPEVTPEATRTPEEIEQIKNKLRLFELI